MESSTWRMTVNEKKFIETALLSDLRTDGRRSFDYRRLTITLGREDGSAEVQLGQTHVMGIATAQLVQPYRDRPDQGTLSIFTEFSPMADPSFEAGRPGEAAVELGRIVDRGLRESAAVDMESLSVVPGKSVWAVRVDLHVLDNGGNLIDTANIAALAALLSFRRPECTVGGENNQDIIIHPPEVREPIPLTIHHLPVAVTFAFFGDDNVMVIDPTHKEEVIMRGRMTATLNANGDVCSIQKAGEQGVNSSVVMQCLRIAAVKAADITSKIKTAVDAYNTERALRNIKRHSSAAAPETSTVEVTMKENQPYVFTRPQARKSEDGTDSKGYGDNVETGSSQRSERSKSNTKPFVGGPSNWDPYSKGISSSLIRNFQAPPDMSTSQVIKRQWTVHEDAKLVECLLELKEMPLWRGEGGNFKVGYLKELERLMEAKMPGCGLKANPHIESRIKRVKKQCNVVAEMLRSSGFGWNDRDKCVTCDANVWEDYVRGHKNAIGLRNKSFPYFDDLASIYGLDRATGADAETPGEAVQAMDNEEAVDLDVDTQVEPPLDDVHGINFGSTNEEQISPPAHGSPAPTRRPGKRKATESPLATAFLSNLEKLRSAYESVNHNLNRIANYYDTETQKIHGLNEAKRLISSELQNIAGLTHNQIISTYKHIMQDNTNIDCFIHLDDVMRTSFVRKMATDHLGYNVDGNDQGPLTLHNENEGSDVQMSTESNPDEPADIIASHTGLVEPSGVTLQNNSPKSLKDAVKPKKSKENKKILY